MMSADAIPSPGTLLGGDEASDTGAAWFVWATWFVLATVALLIVARYAVVVPVGDDYVVTLPILLGKVEVTPQYLWARANEHRFPLVKLLLPAALRATGGWLPFENVLNGVLLIGLAACLMVTAARLRGRYSYTDAFFPLALLHLGHTELLVFRLTFNHVLATGLTCAVLVLIAGQRGGLSAGRGVLVGLVLVLLVLCGANGLPIALGGAAWLALAGWQRRQGAPAGARRCLLLFFLLAAGVTALVGLYFVDTPALSYHPRPASGRELLRGAAVVLARTVTPWQPGLWPWVGLVVPALAGVTGLLLATVILRRPAERLRAAGLLLFLGGTLVVALGVSWGRIALGTAVCSTSRYALVAAPAVLVIYFAWVLYAPARARDLVLVCLFVMFCLTFAQQTADGLHIGQVLCQHGQAFQRDAANGAPTDYLVRRYAGLLYPNANLPRIERILNVIRRQGGEDWGTSAQRGICREETLQLQPVLVHEMKWDGTSGEGQGPDPYVVFALERPRAVRGVYVRFVLEKPANLPAQVQVFWRRREQNEFTAAARNAIFDVSTGATEQVLLFWVHDTIDQFRLDPDSGACRFKIRELRLLIEETPPGGTVRLRSQDEPGRASASAFPAAKRVEGVSGGLVVGRKKAYSRPSTSPGQLIRGAPGRASPTRTKDEG